MPGHDSRCTLRPKPINQKFFSLASSARATDLALKNTLQPNLFDRLRRFCAQFVVWARDKVCSWCIVHGHDSSCTLSPKPIDQKFFKSASLARATDLALKNILQPNFFDRLRPFCAQFVVWARDKVCSWCIVHGHDSRCDLSPKPIDQKFFKLASSARAADLALQNILQPIFLIDCAHFVLSLWYGPQTRFVRGV